MAIYCIEKKAVGSDQLECIEVEANSILTNEEGTRVQLFDADSNPVAAFINVHACYPKPA